MTAVIERWVETDEGEIVLDVQVNFCFRPSRHRDPEAEFIDIERATLPDGTPTKLSDDEYREICDVALERIDYGFDAPATSDDWRIGQDRFERAYY